VFWFYKIVRKILRKLSGEEEIQKDNHMTENEAKLEKEDTSTGTKAKIKRV
jgi:hypothetical protein